MVSLNSLTSLLDANRKCDGRLQLRGRATVTGTIWSLHRVIANPDSTVNEVRTAKRLLLRLLEKTKAFPRLESMEVELGEASASRSPRDMRSSSDVPGRFSNLERPRSFASRCHGDS